MPNFEGSGEHEYSKSPDNGWSYLLATMSEVHPESVNVFTELGKSSSKKQIIEDALLLHGRAWNDLLYFEDTPKATEAFRMMITHWNTPFDGQPKTDEIHKEEANKFAKLLSEEV